MGIRGIVGVDERGLVVPMAQPLLERAKRNAGRGAVSAEGVPEVMEAELAELRSLQSFFEALA